MTPEIAAALIGAGAGLVTAGAAIGTTRHQARKAVEGVFAQASAAYLGPLDTARRTAQREAYSRLLTAAHDYEKAVQAALVDAEALNRDATPNRPAMSPETRAARRARIEEVNDHHLVGAVQHVQLEGPDEVWQSAVRVQKVAMMLSLVLSSEDASSNGLGSPRGLHGQLLVAISEFATAAGRHLGRRDLVLGQGEQARPRWWRRSRS
ncbi:hypothetical protein [Streptomyces sp. AP-93]|uniref:hypothetical protein n=1 Tax=Streptomyces sp. AP-93 TaxID=2929048 RepID=UPI001FB0070A|nr:hypothetical protein [Streptomyces sp. AP-93]MCJ0870199.1 hypothetical protein [Streptomyces sp. AP-93]